MPHVSKNQVSTNILYELDEQIVSFLGETGIKGRQRIFRELFTKTERMMIGKRLMLLLMISKNVPFGSICSSLKMSPSTVSRFSSKIDMGAFKHTLKWFSQDKIRSSLVKFINNWLLPGPRPSLSKILDEQ